MKFAKYSWGYDEEGNEKYAIVQPLEDDSEEVKRVRIEAHIDPNDDGYIGGAWGKIVYGSSCKYEKKGNIFYFRNMEVSDLDTDKVLKEHFVGLI